MASSFVEAVGETARLAIVRLALVVALPVLVVASVALGLLQGLVIVAMATYASCRDSYRDWREMWEAL
jgi:hypothetical protein